MPRLSPERQRTLCLLLLAASTLTLWVPVIDRIGLNPDESQYEATASYLVGQEVSAFLPNGAPAIFLLFKGLTLIAGPYPTTAARIVAMLAAFAIAWMLLRVVGRETNTWCGLLAGLLFLHYAPAFEGYAVNRAWGV